MSIHNTLKKYDLFDNTIYSHGFTDYMRDYRLTARLHVGPSSPGTYAYLFRGCVEAWYESRLSAEGFSMDEVLLDCERWKGVGSPAGFVWGVKYATAYPGWKYIDDSPRAAQWSQKFNRPLHEVTIETNVYKLSLIFSDLTVTKLSRPVA